MTFVDTNVYMYAVGRTHPLRDAARAFFSQAARVREPLCTSAEVLQELMHAYVPPGRLETLDAALTLADSPETEIWPLEREDVYLALRLRRRFPALSARDLCHLACCRRRHVTDIKTFDRAFAGAAEESQRMGA